MVKVLEHLSSTQVQLLLRDNLQFATSYDYSANTVTFYVSASTAEVPTLNAFVIDYNIETADDRRGDFEADRTDVSVPNAESDFTNRDPRNQC